MGQAQYQPPRIQRGAKQNLSSRSLLANKQENSCNVYNIGSTVVKLDDNRVLESKNEFSKTCWIPQVLQKSPTRVTLSIGKAKIASGKVR